MAPSKDAKNGDPPDDGGQGFTAQQLNQLAMALSQHLTPIQQQVNEMRENPFAAIGSLDFGLRDTSHLSGPQSLAINFAEPQSQGPAQTHTPVVPPQVNQSQPQGTPAPVATNQNGLGQTTNSDDGATGKSQPRIAAIPLADALARIHKELMERNHDEAKNFQDEIEEVCDIGNRKRKERTAKERATAGEEDPAEEPLTVEELAAQDRAMEEATARRHAELVADAKKKKDREGEEKKKKAKEENEKRKQDEKEEDDRKKERRKKGAKKNEVEQEEAAKEKAARELAAKKKAAKENANALIAQTKAEKAEAVRKAAALAEDRERQRAIDEATAAANGQIADDEDLSTGDENFVQVEAEDAFDAQTQEELDREMAEEMQRVEKINAKKAAMLAAGGAARQEHHEGSSDDDSSFVDDDGEDDTEQEEEEEFDDDEYREESTIKAESGAPHGQIAPNAGTDDGDNSKTENSSATGSRRSVRLRTPKRDSEIRSSNGTIKRGSGVFGGGGYTEVEDPPERRINEEDPEQLMRDERRKARQQSESGSARGSTASLHEKHKPRRPSRLQNQLVEESSSEESGGGDEVGEGDGEEVPSNLGSSDQEDSGNTPKKRKARSGDESEGSPVDQHQQHGSSGGKRTKRRTSADEHYVEHKKANQCLRLAIEGESDNESDSEGLEASHNESQLTHDEPGADDALGADGSGHVDLTGMPAFYEQDEPSTSGQGSPPDKTESSQIPADDHKPQLERKRRDGHSRSFDNVEYEWDRYVSDTGRSSSSTRRTSQAAQPQQPNVTKGKGKGKDKGKGRLQDADDDEALGKAKDRKRKTSAELETGIFILLHKQKSY